MFWVEDKLPYYLHHVGFLFGLFFVSEDARDVFFPNVD
jgi:hypothetical protein